MTPDRAHPGDTVLDAERTGQVAREAGDVAFGDVPAPRPELLARVLDGLRDLPTARPEPVSGGSGDTVATPLPRRRG